MVDFFRLSSQLLEFLLHCEDLQLSVYFNYRSYLALCKGIQVSPVDPGSRIPRRHGIPDSKLTGSTEMDPGFHRNSWIMDSIHWIPDSTLWTPDSKASHSMDFGFRIPDSFTSGDISFIVYYRVIIFSGLPTKPLDPEIVYARHGQSITLPCSAFEEALQLEGDHVCYVRWSNRTYDGVETQWVPFAMMNGDGGIYVDGDGRFNISKDDGGLYIHEAHPSDNQIYMCTVVLCSGRSPLKNYVTLEFLDDKGKF